MRKAKPYILLGCIVTAVFILALSLPELLMKADFNRPLNEVHRAEQNFGGPDLSMSFVNMSFSDTSLLINEVIEVVKTEAEALDGWPPSKTCDLAASALERFHEAGLYPEVPESGFLNWYTTSWELKHYEDKYFGIYSCDVWVIRFERYDRKVSHTLFLDQGGGIHRIEMTWDETADVNNCKELEGIEKWVKRLGESGREAIPAGLLGFYIPADSGPAEISWEVTKQRFVLTVW